MARSSFPVEVLTPEGKIFEDEVEMVSTRSETGGLGILAHHAPLMAMLEPTELRLYKSESDVVTFAQGEGYLQVIDNSALLILEDATSPDDLDRSELESKLKEAEKSRDESEEGTEEHQRCVREVKRLNTFLDIGEGGS
jgi:F-type H+-transporting ATPase subunit epsilon